MKCSVLNCQNIEQKNGNLLEVNFYGFPTEKEAYHSWIAATGRTGFIPNLNSKICSVHFDANDYDKESGRLKRSAVPTLMLRLETNNSVEPKHQISLSTKDPLSCILNPSATTDNIELVRETMEKNVSESVQAVQSSSVPRSVVLSQTTHKIVNIVSSCNDLFQRYLPQSTDTVVLNYGRKALSSDSGADLRPIVPNVINMQSMQLTSESVSTCISLPPQDLPGHSQSKTLKNFEPKTSPCPIKLVDMKKLLQRPPVESDETTSSFSDKIDYTSNIKSSEQRNRGRKKKTPQRYVGNPNWPMSTAEVIDSNGIEKKSCEVVTVSHVLDCLRVILPRAFDLSRLKPSEKVAALVIKYLKLEYNKHLENQVKVNLKIIIDAANLEEKTFGNDIMHPYHKIKKVAFSIALSRMFSDELSVSKLSNEKLKCLCVLLSQDVFVDGFNILRKRIHNYIREGHQCNAGVNVETIKDNTPSSDQCEGDINTIVDKTLKNSNKRKILPETDHIYNKQKSNNVNVEANIDDSAEVNLDKEKKTNSRKNEKSEAKKAKLVRNIKLIINYLTLKKYSVNFALSKNTVMNNLCKYLHIRSKKSNLEKLKKMLRFIIQKNLNKNNMDMIQDIINSTIQGDNASNENLAKQKNTANATEATCSNYLPPVQHTGVKQNNTLVKKKTEDKLKLRPVVVLHDLVDYASEQLPFMGGEERKYKPNRYHDLRVPLTFTQIISLQKYSSDHVRKLTNKSYREFRRIVMKKNGDKVVFRLHYKNLSPGSSVFVKNFMCPSSGWLKGTVSKMNGPFRYIVQLDNGEYWSCVPEQLRPLPEKEHCAAVTYRSQRNVKPKQLFDL